MTFGVVESLHIPKPDKKSCK